MKKLSEEHYIVVDDSEIKEGDWIGFPNLKKFVPVQYLGGDLTGGEKKITHSTQPLEWFGGEIIFLSEVKELLGVVDVEKKANEYFTETNPYHPEYNEGLHIGYKVGYNQALEDNKDRKYTREDLLDAYTWGFLEGTERGDDVTDSVNKFSQALQPKTEWEVEIVDGKLKLKS